MNKTILRLLSMLLSVLLLLSSCQTIKELSQEPSTDSLGCTSDRRPTSSDPLYGSFPEAELPVYTLTAEKVETVKRQIARCEAISLDETPLAEVEEAWDLLGDMLIEVQEQVTIANLLYYVNMTDPESSNRYSEAVAMIGELEVSYNNACRNVYHEAPDAKREALFAEWSEEELLLLERYTSEVTEIEEANLARYLEQQTLPELHYAEATAVLYANFVADYNRLAELYGYDNYYEYATENVYFRDYGKAEREAFRQAVAEYLVPAFSQLIRKWEKSLEALDTSEMTLLHQLLTADYRSLTSDYLIDYFSSWKGSTQEGLLHAFQNGNAYFTSAEGAFAGAFQVNLPASGTPFCYFGPGYQSTFTVAHEIGHYYAALYREDEGGTMDLMETHSQANEMLLLAHLSKLLPENVYQALRDYRMLDFVSVILLATIVDEFEERVYSLDSTENFESADFDAIMEEVCENYGGYAMLRNTLTDMKQYWRFVVLQSPVYYISYATSGAVAIDFLRQAEEDEEAARECYRQLVEETANTDRFLCALEKAGMTNPFEEYYLIGIRRAALGADTEGLMDLAA